MNVLALLVACNILKYLDRLLIAPVPPLIGREFSATDIELGGASPMDPGSGGALFPSALPVPGTI